jgi:hypothetical protein
MLTGDIGSRAERPAGSLMRSALPGALLAVSAAILVALPLSSNPGLWLAGLAAFLLSVWLVGGQTAYPVLLWVIAMNWLPIIADVLNADLGNNTLGESTLGPFRIEAVIASFCALMALALGMRCGMHLVGWLVRPPTETRAGERSISPRQAAMAFFISYPFVLALGVAAFAAPSLRQPVLAFALLKFVCLYLLAAAAIESGRGYGLLALAVSIELVTGFTGFFSDYKDAIFIVLVALAASRRRLTARMLAFGASAMILLVWLSLVWTAIKPEYRYWVSGYSNAQVAIRPIEDRIKYISERVLDGGINYETTYLKLLRRIGYTHYYAQALSRRDAGLVNIPGRYISAVQHVLMPRVLFPDKESLDDSAVTTALTGEEFTEGTSVGVGYVAEAHVDFGFPGMLLPLLLLGAMMGAGAHYFMTRAAPLVIRQAFTAASLFTAFRYEMNIDKALGGYLVAFIALAVALKFGYPIVANWLMRRPRRRPSAEIAA